MQLHANLTHLCSPDLQLTSHGGGVIPKACSFNVSEGWYEVYVTRSAIGCTEQPDKVMVDKKSHTLLTVRIFDSFNVVDVASSKTLFEVFWSYQVGSAVRVENLQQEESAV